MSALVYMFDKKYFPCWLLDVWLTFYLFKDWKKINSNKLDYWEEKKEDCS